MPTHDTYMLHIYRSRAVSGWQWVARLEQLPGGGSLRFSDSEALLAHLRTILHAGDPNDPATNESPGTAGPTTTEDDGTTYGD